MKGHSCMAHNRACPGLPVPDILNILKVVHKGAAVIHHLAAITAATI